MFKVKKMWTSFLTMMLVLSIQIQGQIRILDFDPPFRLKNLQWFNASDDWGEVWSVGGQGNLVIKTKNERKSCSISKVDLNSLFFVDYQTALVVGNLGEILTTENRGRSWNKKNSLTSKNLFSAFCVDEYNCWIVGQSGLILKGGIKTKWQEQIVGNNDFVDVYFSDTKTGYILAKDGLLLKTIDGGKTWKEIVIPYNKSVKSEFDNNLMLETVVFKDKERGCVAGSEIVACTTNGGETWKVQEIEYKHFIGIIFSV